MTRFLNFFYVHLITCLFNPYQIGAGYQLEENINTNYFGPRRVNDAFGKFLQRPGGRIVNVGSAAGANYVNKIPDTSASIKKYLSQPWTIPGGIAEIDEMSRNAKSVLPQSDDSYGASKALLHAYTIVHAKIDKGLFINAVTPGFIATDLTAGYGASNPPSKGAIPPCYLMMDEELIPNTPSGRYYGSDCIRSPIAFYRGPGDAPYENDDDLVDLPSTAVMMPSVL
jgi:carbonyl reductase 1